MSSVVPTRLDTLCPSMRHLAQHGRREPGAPLDNLGMAMRSLGVAPYFVAEATVGTPGPTVLAIIDHLIENKQRPQYKVLRGVVFYTLPELRHAIHRGEPLPIYFTGIDMLTLRFIPSQQAAEEVSQQFLWWNLAVEWSGKAGDAAKLWLDSIMPPD